MIPKIGEEATALLTSLPKLVTGGELSRIPLPHFLDPIRDQIIAITKREAASLETSLVPFLQQAGTRILSGLGYVLP